MERRLLAALGLVLLGTVLVANPVYLWPHYAAQDAEEVRAQPVTPPESTGDGPNPIHVESVPGDTSTALEAAIAAVPRDPEPREIWPLRSPVPASGRWPVFDPGEAPTEGLPNDPTRTPVGPLVVEGVDGTTHPVVVTDGDAPYVVGIVPVERSPPVPTPLRLGMAVVATLALASGATLAARDRLRFSTRSAWVVVPIWLCLTIGTLLYDGGTSGVLPAVGIEQFGPTPTGIAQFAILCYLLALPPLGFVVGTGFKRRRWRDGIGRPREVAATVALTAGVGLLLVVPGAIVGYAFAGPRDE